jgi:hypothetical protein
MPLETLQRGVNQGEVLVNVRNWVNGRPPGSTAAIYCCYSSTNNEKNADCFMGAIFSGRDIRFLVLELGNGAGRYPFLLSFTLRKGDMWFLKRI